MTEEKRKQAVALRYDKETTHAPTITATGKGHVADNIIKHAITNDIPIQEDPSLVELLSKLNVHQQIPEELYQAVAEVFAFIYQADKEMSNKK
ncbi:EscU/YscU/HrcU family type III secretion system export apparatus switch protein [Aquibacillus salsiterrae]|uniref:EscU/YscU/HrcU family type III secretion system export apparatus switch protein n=1 Tax=Aquibacillus salsiterrae TaxID=2950439 RepID=A0A9X4AFP1_9BACI|nr:EscU/YscU/HrcU family type III secretion system export apparatus switch protein [Aquibacillus salsiterrae]MDC3416410.1 EscU/YscU/HrcU family type III secretion system export apparatus switch protein [Aquibacillus salsiterrae]